MDTQRVTKSDGPHHTVASLAIRFAVTETTIRRWVYSGKLFPIKVGSVLRFPASEVRRFESENQIHYAYNGDESDLSGKGVA